MTTVLVALQRSSRYTPRMMRYFALAQPLISVPFNFSLSFLDFQTRERDAPHVSTPDRFSRVWEERNYSKLSALAYVRG